MGVNRGKQFESQIRDGFERVADTHVMRLIDPQGKQKGVGNICDFVIYHYPRQFCIECKSCYGSTLSIYSNDPEHKYGKISNKQWEGMLTASEVSGVVCGVMLWFIDFDRTVFVPIKELQRLRDSGAKSVNIRKCDFDYLEVKGNKKRILFDYDMKDFFRNFNIVVD